MRSRSEAPFESPPGAIRHLVQSPFPRAPQPDGMADRLNKASLLVTGPWCAQAVLCELHRPYPRRLRVGERFPEQAAHAIGFSRLD